MFQLCINQLVIWFVQVHRIIDLFIAYPSPQPGALACPFTPKVLQVKECTPIHSSIISTFRLTFESFKEFGGASIGVDDNFLFQRSKKLCCSSSHLNKPFFFKRSVSGFANVKKFFMKFL